MKGQTLFQIGKAGIKEGTIDSLLLAFKRHNQIRISVLKSSGRDRNSIAKIGEELCSKLKERTGKKYLFRVIGFTIILKN